VKQRPSNVYFKELPGEGDGSGICMGKVNGFEGDGWGYGTGFFRGDGQAPNTYDYRPRDQYEEGE